MSEKSEKLEDFVATYRGGVVHIERNLAFGTDEVRIKVAIKGESVTAMTLTQLHAASLQVAIRHLEGKLSLLGTRQA